MHHGGLVFLRDAVESFLDNVAAESIHTEGERVATNRLSDGNDLVGCAMLKAALNKEIAETVDHQRVGLSNDSFDNLVLLVRCADFELLLEEDRSLLVVVADYLVYNILPIAAHVPIQQPTVVHGLDRRHVLRRSCLTRVL